MHQLVNVEDKLVDDVLKEKFAYSQKFYKVGEFCDEKELVDILVKDVEEEEVGVKYLELISNREYLLTKGETRGRGSSH